MFQFENQALSAEVIRPMRPGFLRRSHESQPGRVLPRGRSGADRARWDNLFRSIVANCKYEIDMRRAGLRKLVPALAAQALGG